MNQTEQAELNRLSPDQLEIYQRLTNGETVEDIARKMDRPIGIIAAQCTRISNKGISLPQTAPPAAPVCGNRPKPEPVADQLEEVKKIVEHAAASTAEYDVDAVIMEVQSKTGNNLAVREIHPMILLGITMQFMRLAGGRMHAHQLIEDIYGTMQIMADGSRRDLPGVTTHTKPWPPAPNSPPPISTAEAGSQSIADLLNQMHADQQRQSEELRRLADQLRYSE